MSETAEASSETEEGRGASTRTRRCIATGDVLPEARLLRFVADPHAKVMVDVEAKLPGRGLWVRSERTAIKRAAEKQLFARAAKLPLRADADLDEQAETRLAERMLAQLGLAHRSGQLVLGFDTVERTLRGAAPLAVIIQASDAAADGGRKLQAAALARGLVPFVIGCFSGADLSLALGRANVVHAALKPGRMAERLIFDAGRLSGFRPLKSWIWVGFQEGRAEMARPFV
jgi:predicted RNA-binding protein YlxR (DUF448 family)